METQISHDVASPTSRACVISWGGRIDSGAGEAPGMHGLGNRRPPDIHATFRRNAPLHNEIPQPGNRHPQDYQGNGTRIICRMFQKKADVGGAGKEMEMEFQKSWGTMNDGR